MNFLNCYKIVHLRHYYLGFKNIEYNIGGHFEGIKFTAPKDGIYSFFATAQHKSDSEGEIQLRLNDKNAAITKNKKNNSSLATVCIQTSIETTLELKQKDEVSLGQFSN